MELVIYLFAILGLIAYMFLALGVGIDTWQTINNHTAYGFGICLLAGIFWPIPASLSILIDPWINR